jgi:hypothetical protein
MDEGAKFPFALGPKHSFGGPAPVFNRSFSGIHIVQSLVFWVVFYRLLFIFFCLFFFLSFVYFLFSFDGWFPITPLVSSDFSYRCLTLLVALFAIC